MIDDLRGFSQSAANIDKKLLVNSGNWINAPVLLAWEEFPELGPLIEREFDQEGDTEQVKRGYNLHSA